MKFFKLPTGGWRQKLPWIIVLVQAILMLYKWGYRPTLRETRRQVSTYRDPDDDQPLTDAEKSALWDVAVPITKSATRVFYNRVPKCGSSALLETFEILSKKNNFTFIRTTNYMTFRIDPAHQRAFVKDFQSVPTPMLMERHMHFVDFQKLSNGEQPIYINIIREPLDRMISWYYFRRYQEGHVRSMPTNQRVRTFDECVFSNQSECVEPMGDHPEEGYFKLIPFFCGQEDFCKNPTDQALINAVRNVKQSFAVVGLLEEYERFVEALEFLFPQYFKGAVNVFRNLERWNQRFRTTFKLPPSKEAIRIMQGKMKKEYQFYLFIRQRFHRLMERIEAVRDGRKKK